MFQSHNLCIILLLYFLMPHGRAKLVSWRLLDLLRRIASFILKNTVRGKNDYYFKNVLVIREHGQSWRSQPWHDLFRGIVWTWRRLKLRTNFTCLTRNFSTRQSFAISGLELATFRLWVDDFADWTTTALFLYTWKNYCRHLYSKIRYFHYYSFFSLYTLLESLW